MQLVTPLELYKQPATPFVATFVGSPPMNLLPASWEEQAGQSLVTCHQASFAVPAALAARLKTFRSRALLLGIRPEHLHLTEASTEPALPGTVRAVEALGCETFLHVQLDTVLLLVVSDARRYTPGDVVRLRPELDRLHVFPPEP